MRLSVLAATLMLAASPALAAPLCDGRYDGAAAMVDAAIGKYGTLYSGGDHWHRLDHVGATLDLLRLWRDKPDAGFRAAKLPYDTDMPLFDPATYAQVVGAALDNAEADAPAPDTLAQTALALDLGTTLGDSPDWWRHDGAKPDSNNAALVALAAQRPALDWLQVVLAASDAPWALGWNQPDLMGDRSEGFDRLRADALDKARAGQGLEWAVAAQMLWRPGAAEDADLQAQAATWRGKVRECSASPAEYAAFAVTASRRAGAESLALLPLRTAQWVGRNIAISMVAEGKPQDLETLPEDNAQFATWLAVGRTYATGSITEIEDIHRGRKVDGKSLRALNMLPANILQMLVLSDVFHGRDRVTLLRATFTRQVVLGRHKDARLLLSALRQADPKSAIPALERHLPEDVTLALAAARLPGLSTLISGEPDGGFEYDAGVALYNDRYRLELPEDFADGTAIQRDLETWLMLPQRWGRFYSMHCLTWAALDRVNARGRYGSRGEPSPAPELLGEHSAFGFARLVNFHELALLRGDNGVVRQISQILLPWAEAESSNGIKRMFNHPDLTAEALYRVVMLARHADPDMEDLTPLARRAFALLHQRFPNSTWARKAKIWRGPRESECGCRE